jgi:carbamoyl-phosphate synthase large subunit
MTDLDCVLVAGVGGASLGTEVAKSLALARSYRIFACDISTHAYGLHDPIFENAACLERENYAEQVLSLCLEWGVHSVIPGGEEPLRLLVDAGSAFARVGIVVATNEADLIRTCVDKQRLFRQLELLGFPIPWTRAVEDPRTLQRDTIPEFPCVIKPASLSGGSAFVFFVETFEELGMYAQLISRACGSAIVQEYVGLDEGEFTIGVLSVPEAGLVGSIALRRLFDSKLSVAMQTSNCLISSGYSQGLIDDFPEVCMQAEKIAAALGSIGPINVQARMRDGVLFPFEIIFWRTHNAPWASLSAVSLGIGIPRRTKATTWRRRSNRCSTRRTPPLRLSCRTTTVRITQQQYSRASATVSLLFRPEIPSAPLPTTISSRLISRQSG